MGNKRTISIGKSHSKKDESCWSPYVKSSAIDLSASITKSFIK